METTTPSEQSTTESSIAERTSEERSLLSLGLVSLNRATLSDLHQSIALLKKAGQFPDKVASVENAVSILLQGKELGFGYYESLKFIDVINNMPTLNGAGQGALLRRNGIRWRLIEDAKPVKIGPKDTDIDYVTTIEFYDPDPKTPEEFKLLRFKFSYSEALTQNLTEKAVWKKMWITMLRWRAFTGGARFYFSAITHKLYTPEEIDPTYEEVEEWS